MALIFISVIFCACSFVLLLLANLGTTFNSTFLPKLFLTQVNQASTNMFIRYGIYNSCLYDNNGSLPISCTAKMPAYSFDAKQFATLCGANDVTQTALFEEYASKANIATFKTLVLVMPALILCFLALCCALTMRRYRSSNTIPFMGTFFSLIGFFCGAAGLALIIVTFWKGLDALRKLIDGLSYQWGPSIYIIGIGTGCLLISLICFVISLFSRPSDDYDRETLQLGNRDSQFENNNVDAKFHAFSTPPPERGSYYQPYQTHAPYTPQHTHNQQYSYGQNNYSNSNANYSSNYY